MVVVGQVAISRNRKEADFRSRARHDRASMSADARDLLAAALFAAIPLASAGRHRLAETARSAAAAPAQNYVGVIVISLAAASGPRASFTTYDQEGVRLVNLEKWPGVVMNGGDAAALSGRSSTRVEPPHVPQCVPFISPQQRPR